MPTWVWILIGGIVFILIIVVIVVVILLTRHKTTTTATPATPITLPSTTSPNSSAPPSITTSVSGPAPPPSAPTPPSQPSGPLPPAGTPPGIYNKNELYSGTTQGVLQTNQQLTSPNGNFFLIMQNDGNLVEYRSNTDPVRPGSVVWASHSSSILGNRNYQAILNANGSLMITPNNVTIWNPQSGGKGTSPYVLILSNDGNLQILDSTGLPLWDNQIHTT